MLKRGTPAIAQSHLMPARPDQGTHPRCTASKVSSAHEAKGGAANGEGGKTDASAGDWRVGKYQPGDRPGAAAVRARGDRLQSWAPSRSAAGGRPYRAGGPEGARTVRGNHARAGSGSGHR